MLVNIEKIKIIDRTRKDLGNIKELAESIKEIGLLQFPVVTEEFVLVAGERRLAACKLLDWQQLNVNVVKFEDYLCQLKAERDENTTRKDFTFSEMVELGKKIEAVEYERSKQVSLSNLKQFQNMGTECQNSDTRKDGRINGKIAQDVGFGSHDTYHRAKFIAEHADSEVIRQLDEKQISINKAYQQTKTRLEATEHALTEAKNGVQALQKELEVTNSRAIESEEELRETKRKISQFQETANDLIKKAKRESQRESTETISQLEEKIAIMTERIDRLTTAERDTKSKAKELSEKLSEAKKKLTEIESSNLQKKLDDALVEIKNLKERPLTKEIEKELRDLEKQKKYLETEIADRQNAIVVVNDMRKITKMLNGVKPLPPTLCLEARAS